MNNKFESFLSIDFANFSRPDNLSTLEAPRFDSSVIMMREMQKLITKSIAVCKTAEIPLKLIQGLEGIVEDFEAFTKMLSDIRNPQNRSEPARAFDQIHAYHANFFEMSGNNKFLTIINAIANYADSFDIMSIKRIEGLDKELKEKVLRADAILEKLEKPSAEKVLSEYADEYSKEESKCLKASNTWIVRGIVASVVFIAIVIVSIVFELFPSKLKLLQNSGFVETSTEIINIPVLVTKIMLLSILIYFIAFCFRQFSINKHLAIINQNRKNAFNSYQLFAASIGQTDQEAKRILLMSLAKSIHESINSGFLSSKQLDQVSVQNFDLGKLGSFQNK